MDKISFYILDFLFKNELLPHSVLYTYNTCAIFVE